MAQCSVMQILSLALNRLTEVARAIQPCYRELIGPAEEISSKYYTVPSKASLIAMHTTRLCCLLTACHSFVETQDKLAHRELCTALTRPLLASELSHDISARHYNLQYR